MPTFSDLLQVAGTLMQRTGSIAIKISVVPRWYGVTVLIVSKVVRLLEEAIAHEEHVPRSFQL
jgi:hypothetical protein